MDNITRFGVVGCGHIGARHMDMIHQHPGCELAAIVDTDPGKRALAEGATRFFQSLDELLQSSIEVDVINIATPNGLHAAQAVACLRSGKHVVIEKPMALTHSDCEHILAVAGQNNRKVFCVMQNRYSAPMIWLKDIVERNLLGNIFMVNISCYWNRDNRYYAASNWHGNVQMDGGTLFTQFSHYVDLLYWLFGDVNITNGYFANNNHVGMIGFEDTGIVDFTLQAGGAGSLVYTTSAWNKNMESSLVVIGENGSVKIGGQYMDKIEYCHIKDYTLKDMDSGQLTLPGYNNAKANHYFVIQNVVDVLNGLSEITTTGEEGAKVVDIIERIYALKK